MKVRYNPDENLEARLIRQLTNKQEDIAAFDGKAKAKKKFLSELKLYFPETYQRWKAKT